jgi:hypothetical protein
MIVSGVPAHFERRIVLNYRIDPAIASRAMPPPFRPHLESGWAIGGLCIAHLRPAVPRFVRSVVSVAHRFVVETPGGGPAVYVPRRDTSSLVATLIGGRVVPGVQQRATIVSTLDDGAVAVDLSSTDGRMQVELRAQVRSEIDPASVYRDEADASAALRHAPMGYSPARSAGRLEVVELCADDWRLTPLSIDRVASSYFDDVRMFPVGSIEPDSAFVMTDVAHRWRLHPRRSTSAV